MYRDIEGNFISGINTWFNGAADHFFELEIPEQFKDTEIEKRMIKLRDKGLKYRLTTERLIKKQFEDFFNELEDLIIMIDKELGLKPIKANWS